MPVKTIPLLILLLLNAVFTVSGDNEKTSAQPHGQTESSSPDPNKKSRYFQDSGSQVDSLVDRIRFKIDYSWSKSAEYFRLACSSITDSAQTRGRDLKAHADSKKDELLEKGTQAVRETAKQTMEDISRKGSEIKQEVNKMGQEIKDDASKEIRENTDKFFK